MIDAWQPPWDFLRWCRSRIQSQDYYPVNSEELCARRLAEVVFAVFAVDSDSQSGVPAFAQVPRETTAQKPWTEHYSRTSPKMSFLPHNSLSNPTLVTKIVMTRVGFFEQKGASAMVAGLTKGNMEFVAKLSAKAHRVAGRLK